MGLKGGTFKKIGRTIRRVSRVLDPVGHKIVGKGLKAAGMNPDDPLNLDKRFTTAAAEEAAKTADDLAREQRAMQATQLAELDEEENRRIKKLLSASRGTRVRRGSMFRSLPTNTAARAPAGGGSGSVSAGALRAGGARGGLRFSNPER